MINNTHNDIIEIQQWINPEQVQLLKDIVSNWEPTPSIPSGGHFANELVSMQHFYDWCDNDNLAQILLQPMQELFGAFRVSECVYQELHKPWDIHCDYTRNTLDNPDPWRSILIPLEAADSSTVIFKETADYNDFYKYKQTMPRSPTPVSAEFWQQHLDFCWAEDREWLTLDHVSHSWIPGNLLSFPRNRWHSSDNFHKRTDSPKKFLQILIDRV